MLNTYMLQSGQALVLVWIFAEVALGKSLTPLCGNLPPQDNPYIPPDLGLCEASLKGPLSSVCSGLSTDISLQGHGSRSTSLSQNYHHCWNFLGPNICQLPCSNCLACGITIGSTTQTCLLPRAIGHPSSHPCSAAPVTRPFPAPLSTRSTSEQHMQVTLAQLGIKGRVSSLQAQW